MLTTILTATAAMAALALLFCLILVAANVKFHVEVPPEQEAIEAHLPGANCGGCGLAGCGPFAKAVFEKQAPIDGCTVGGPAVAEAIASILGVTVEESYPYRPVVHCGATAGERKGRGNYVGEQTCAAAHVVGGVQGCVYGCLGFGDCVSACEYDAIHVVDGLARIDYVKCVGCGACVRACPREIIEQIPFKAEQMLVVACSNRDPGKDVRAVCEVGCIGCSACARVMGEVFTIEGNLARMDYDKVLPDTDFEKAEAKCPMKSMVHFGPPLPRYDEELDGVPAVAVADMPDAPARPTAEDMDWRG